MSFHFLYVHEVRDGLHHASDLGTILLDDDIADALETQRAQGVALVLLASDAGLDLGDLELRHGVPTPAAAVSSAFAAASATPSLPARSRAAGATSSTVRPRRLATS